MGAEMWEIISKPKILHNLVHGEPKLKPPPSPEGLIERIKLRKWTVRAQNDLMEAINIMRYEVKIIEHLPKRWIWQMELKLDVERYMGNHSFWWLNLQDNQYLERRYRRCPKIRDYHVYSYWEQYKYYQKHGTVDIPGENTLQFILDRAKWAYKIYAKQIHVARQLLKMLRNWNFFNPDQLHEFNRIYERLGRYNIALPIDL
jgi:hypothetical protein